MFPSRTPEPGEYLQPREVRTLAIWLKVPPPASTMILCDPGKPHPIARILTEDRTWFSLEAGDRIALVKNDRREEFEVAGIELHQVRPLRFQGLFVRSAMAWMLFVDDGRPRE